LLVALPIAWIFDWLLQRRTRAKIHGSSIQVSARQFPEIHQCIAEYSRRLGLSDPPRTYVVESNETNAFALRSFGRRLVLLNDDIIFACLRTNPHALKFIIAHELAHHALHHTHLFRSYVRQCVPSLSRLDEFSADRVAAALVNDERSCADALTVLLSGPQLFGLLNRAALAQQAAEVAGTKLSLKAEKRLSHPLLLRRLARFSTALS
jgi:Zn-dependent protease with chaperone function